MSEQNKSLVEFCSNWFCQTCEVDFTTGFVNVDLWISLSCYIGVERVKVSMPWVRCAFGNIYFVVQGLEMKCVPRLLSPSNSSRFVELLNHKIFYPQ